MSLRRPKPLAAAAISELPDTQAETAGHSGIQRQDALDALVAAVRQRHGEASAAVLFYGSCLRSGDPAAGIADFYVAVHSYRAAGMGWLAATANWLLAPNVFYLEVPLQGHVLRAKYAVVRYDQFINGCSGAWLLPYLWGRFAQPSQIAWAASDIERSQLQAALERARQVFLRRCTSALEGRFSTAQLWQEALLMSYRTELRAEQREKIRSLVESDPGYYAFHTPRDLASLPWVREEASNQPPPDKRDEKHVAEVQAELMHQQFFLIAPSHPEYGRWVWRLRQVLGKLTSVLRLFKSLFTFVGAVDYAVWKIQRHSGRRVEVPEWVRRYPWIGAWLVLWRLWRSGQLK